ncbi:MAG: hypothetical protein CM15mP74_32770 [Halieaceae bacterium]|nr:MAG: hypothetical protein CM15mP74_32770 [Halieaceae bacterium]
MVSRNEIFFPPEPSFPAFGPEYVDFLEAGFKRELFDNSLRANLRSTSDYTDLQILINDRESWAVHHQRGRPTIGGFRTEINYLAGMVFWDLAVGYTDAGYDFLNPDLFSGLSVLPPSYSYQSGIPISGSQKPSIPKLGEITPRRDWHGGEILHKCGWAPVCPPGQTPGSPDYSVVNISARWQSASSGLSVTAGVDNVGDEEFSIFGDYQSTFGSTAQAFDRGRQYFVMLGYSF